MTKNGKMALKKLLITDPLKFESLVSECQRNGNICVSHYGKIAVALQNLILEQNYQFPSKPKVFNLPHDAPMCSFTLPNIRIIDLVDKMG